MAWNIFEITINCFQSYLIVYYIFHCLRFKPHLRQWDCILYLCCVLFFSLFLFIPMPPIDIAVFLIPFFFSLCFSSERYMTIFYWHFLLALVFSLVAGLMNNIYAIVLTILETVSINNKWHYLLYLLASNVVMYCLISLITKLGTLQVSWGRNIYIAFMSMISAILVCEESLYYFQESILVEGGQLFLLLILHIALIICTFLAVYLFRTVALNTQKESRYQAELSLLSQAHQHQEELTTTYAELISYKHDIKHHFQVLSQLIISGDVTEAQSYLGIVQGKFESKSVFVTGCTAMDALLTAKNSTMKSHGISFRYTPYPLCELPIPMIDFCSITGNLLDNAIEGNLRIPQDQRTGPFIHLSFSRVADMFYIRCENPCNPLAIKKEAGHYTSTKKEETNCLHGMGIDSINRIALQFEGRCSFYTEENIFCAQVVLPYLFVAKR